MPPIAMGASLSMSTPICSPLSIFALALALPRIRVFSTVKHLMISARR